MTSTNDIYCGETALLHVSSRPVEVHVSSNSEVNRSHHVVKGNSRNQSWAKERAAHTSPNPRHEGKSAEKCKRQSLGHFTHHTTPRLPRPSKSSAGRYAYAQEVVEAQLKRGRPSGPDLQVTSFILVHNVWQAPDATHCGTIPGLPRFLAAWRYFACVRHALGDSELTCNSLK